LCGKYNTWYIGDPKVQAWEGALLVIRIVIHLGEIAAGTQRRWALECHSLHSEGSKARVHWTET